MTKPGEVQVCLMQRADKTLYYEVYVASSVKRGLLNKGIMEFERGNQSQKIAALAGALAEIFCEKYSDTIDPSECARNGFDAYSELMAENPHIMMGDELPRAADVNTSSGRMA